MHASDDGRHDSATGHALSDYVHKLGVPDLPRLTMPFDPGYDPMTVESHLAQSGHLMAALKLSMTCWQVTSPEATEAKIAAAKAHDVPLMAGGATFEIAVQQHTLDEYFALCALLGIDGIEAGEGFTDLTISAEDTLKLAGEFALEVQFELGRKQEAVFDPERIKELVEQGKEWLDAGAVRLVVEARESAQGVGLFDERGMLCREPTDLLVEGLGLEALCFEAPTKSSQFALLKHLGPDVLLSNVRLEELLRIEIFRRGMHADSYGHPLLGTWSQSPQLDGASPGA